MNKTMGLWTYTTTVKKKSLFSVFNTIKLFQVQWKAIALISGSVHIHFVTFYFFLKKSTA